tara:strand:- start:400 stop:2166 length:1767 start_codon:yes stop_codon:yes gene_type:complete
MDLVPVIIISKQQGVPIPNNDFSFRVSNEDFEKFRTAELLLRGTPLKNIFLIGISPEDQLALNLLLTAEEKLDSTALIGVLAQLKSVSQDNFEKVITARVLTRAKIDKFVKEEKQIKAPLKVIKEKILPGEDTLLHDMRLLVNHLIKSEGNITENTKDRILATKDLIKISNILAGSLPMDEEDKYSYIQYQDNLDRFTLILRYLVKMLDEAGEHSQEIQKVKESTASHILAKNFMTLINDLNRNIEFQSEARSENAEQYNSLILEVPEGIAKKIEKENQRLQNLPPTSMEYQTVQEYLDWLTSIPWTTKNFKPVDLKTFVSVLDQSHYGLDEVKQHILEYMAIEKLTDGTRGTILCFTGPPGTGKTSIAKQIAKATNRELVKIALGGMSDEAEIRGHRRTYVAARPGRIINGLIRSESMDPLFLLDEVDKIGEAKGDPLSALLELLDPEQNDEFIDRYIEEPVDLSKAMFICTSNYLDRIPEPLKDRLEIIEFREYKEEERKIILEDFLIEKIKDDYSISEFNININEEAIQLLAKTKGVREIERRTRKLLRKAVVDILVREEESVNIDSKYIEETLKALEEDKKLGF